MKHITAEGKSDLPSVTPQRRNLRFHLPPDRVNDWHKYGVHVTTLFNCLSIFFPVGETFFMDAITNYRKEIPAGSLLSEQVTQFIGQESYHTREHEVLNDVLSRHFPVAAMEALVQSVLRFFNLFPRIVPLGGTVALEHLTAVLGHTMLTDEDVFDGSETHYESMWRWHALEEVEHKAVSFDVYALVVGQGALAYAFRIFAFILANAIFWSLLAVYYCYMLWMQGKLFDMRGWGVLLATLFGSPGPGRGLFRRVLPLWFDFFRTDFHPWQHDNSHYLARILSVVSASQAFGKGMEGKGKSA